MGLRQLLLSGAPRKLEKLAGDLLGELIGVEFRVAGGGSQRGGDGSVHGKRGRHLIYEARQLDKSRFNDRSIRGEIDEAVQRDPALEAWILVTTRAVREQTVTAMEDAGRPRGIETLVVDWAPERMPRLAALCASAPSIVEALYGEACREPLSAISSSEHYPGVLKSVKQDLRAPAVGYELLRQASHARVRDVWAKPRKAEAVFGQNVAGGAAEAAHVERVGPMAELDTWYREAGRDQPAVVLGREGRGKTWATVGWLRSRLEQQPIVVLAPSTSITTPLRERSSLVEFIARCLRDLNDVSDRDRAFWEKRVQVLLRRPLDEGPVFTLVLDGLNEEPSFDWLSLFNRLQDEPFYGRVCVIASARASFVAERMENLRGRVWQAKRIEVGLYDDRAGGEFDKKLTIAGLDRKDVPGSLVELARVPRLFDLVIRLRDRLGGLEAVTEHRLFWEHGATAIRGRAFSVTQWRSFVLDLATDFRKGIGARSLRQVEELSSSPATTPDEVYQRVSSLIDSVYAQVSESGRVTFDPAFVRYALGLALIHELEGKNVATCRDTLERFLEPLNSHDEEAEVVRAAVSIGLARGSDGNLDALGTLCCWWVQCQNVPESHVAELRVLAPELVEPLLDAVERCEGHAAISPRYRAVNALCHIDLSDRATARAICARGASWMSRLSQEGWDGNRRQRLKSKVGTCEAGWVTVLGRRVEIVNRADEDLGAVAAQLLQDRPLAEAISFFEAGAVWQAITGESTEEQGWLNLLNPVDPAETAALLRKSSAAMARHQPEPGVHSDLNSRVAAILLWRTGYEEDEERALALDPISSRPSYHVAYLTDPAASRYRLERRHADMTLRRPDVALRSRIQRAAEFLVDPTLCVPQSIGDEVVSAACMLDLDSMAVGRFASAEDNAWRDLTLVMARFAPQELARIERARLRGYAKREGEGRLGAAIAAPDAMLLVGDAERAALRQLRERKPDHREDMEPGIRNELLIAEVQGEEGGCQLRRIMRAESEVVDVSLSEACGSPSMSELDEIVAEHRSDPRQLSRIAEAIGEKRAPLGETVFTTFAELLFREGDDIAAEPFWMVLGTNEPERLGRILDERCWSWSADKRYIENVMGSLALAAANRNVPFERFAGRLAPVTLLTALHGRECERGSVSLAVKLLGEVVLKSTKEPPETTLEIMHDRTAAEQRLNYMYTCGDIVDPDDDMDSVEPFVARLHDNYEERRRELVGQYRKEVMAARRDGMHFYLEFVNPAHFHFVLESCPEALDGWLEGMADRCPEFQKRVRSANGFFVSLCEALLVRSPERGVLLWRALRECLTEVRFTVDGELDRLLQALWSASGSPEVDLALEEVYAAEVARTDRDLVDLVVVARRTNRLDWLRNMVARDAVSSCPLHRRRSMFLEPLLAIPEIAEADTWPKGELGGGVRGASWKLGQREAIAQHWLRTFWEADTVALAHAAWRLFLASADRRAWVWMSDVLDEPAKGEPELQAKKLRFVGAQMRRLRRAMADNEKQWADNFAHRRYPEALRPWNG